MDQVGRFASLIAYMEGVEKLPLPADAHDTSSANLEKRIAALERVAGIASPAPGEAASWNGLTWRAWRVRYTQTHWTVPDHMERAKMHAAMVNQDDCTLASLRAAVDGLGGALPALECCSCAEGSEAKIRGECLYAMVQKLAYISGLHRRAFPDAEWSEALIFAYAGMVLFIVIGQRPRPMIHRPPTMANGIAQPHQIPPGISLFRRPEKGSGIKGGGLKLTAKELRKFGGKKSGGRFAWLNRLCFWRTKRSWSVSSSSSSGSSTEVVN
ncbi:hypothetical protein IF1G_00100 [Cordyceps javanica]|uniref:Uncharacterized protein n=1 Tax=Cordyceps javanica TaxID=43265 RepID=A0A545WBK8_9HYPO|nr:hypothetical protein IF1G_00100 [Cordyceps javanica]TQW11370.1 hypothetical protein IF2G_00101 [Cordyceps javanica]